jgi:hypothetical protein
MERIAAAADCCEPEEKDEKRVHREFFTKKLWL